MLIKLDSGQYVNSYDIQKTDLMPDGWHALIDVKITDADFAKIAAAQCGEKK